MSITDISLRDLNILSTKVRVFVVQEPRAEVPNSETDSAQLAISFGLIDPAIADSGSFRTYRVLGFDPIRLWCESTKLVALDKAVKVTPYIGTTNCENLTGISYIDLERKSSVPFVSLDYYESLLDFAESEYGDLTVLDSPSLDGRIEQIWWDGTRFHAKVWLKGSYKGKNKTITVEFVYNPHDQKVCLPFESVKNDFIRIEDIEICWYLIRSVICAKATVIWRLIPRIRAHVEVCMAFAQSFPCPQQSSDPSSAKRVGSEEANR